MDKILNWGLLSTARINRSLIPILRASKQNRLLAVASRNISSAEAYANEWKIPRAHGRYEDLLADPEIDIIYNPLPNHMHAEWSIKAMRAGKHVLCEKPFALTLADVDEMSSVSKETGKVIMEAFMYRHHPQTLKVKELVEDGILGEIRFIRGSFSFILTRPGDIRTVKEYGGGSIWDVGCYPISYARMILGVEPVEVFGWQASGPGGSDNTFVGQMRFPNNVFFQFESSFVHPHRAQMEIVGNKASLLIPHPFKPERSTQLILNKDGESETLKVKGNDLYLGEVNDMYAAVLGNKLPRISLEDTRGNISAILAFLRSAEEKKPVFV